MLERPVRNAWAAVVIAQGSRMDGPISIPVSPGRERELLRTFLSAQLDYERASSARGRFVHLAAVLSVIPCVTATWPEVLPTPLFVLGMIGWSLSALGALIAGMREWRCYRRRAHLTSCLDRETSVHQLEQG